MRAIKRLQACTNFTSQDKNQWKLSLMIADVGNSESNIHNYIIKTFDLIIVYANE